VIDVAESTDAAEFLTVCDDYTFELYSYPSKDWHNTNCRVILVVELVVP